MKLNICSILTVTAALSIRPAPAVTQEAPNGALRVFLDCQFFCQMDHYRREVPFVNYVRDRQDAQVHVLGLRQQTGGGTEFTFTFIGLDDFAGREDTLRFSTSNTDTEAERRDQQVSSFLRGLIPFVEGTPVARRILVSYDAPDDGQQTPAAQPEDDPWNFWVFRINGGAFAFKESLISDISVNGGVRASRTTEEWKLEFEANGRFSENRIELSDTVTSVNTRRSYRIEASAVNSIGPENWAFGAEARVSASTFSNQDMTARVAAAVEYSVFPYSESTRRELTIMYSIGLSYFDYEAITIFGRQTETRPDQQVEIEYEVVQPWGNIDLSLDWQNYLHDFSLHRLSFGGGLRFRLVRGLSLRLGGDVARIKNQIFLSGADIPPEEILLRRRQLGTEFRLVGNFNLSYTFGSIFNNVVNPRMR